MDLIDRKTLRDELESLRVTVTGLRAGKGVLASYAKEFRGAVLQIVDDQAEIAKEEVAEDTLADIAQDFVQTLKNRQWSFEPEMAARWCQEYQEEKGIELPKDQEMAFIEGMLYGNKIIYDDLIEMLECNGFDF